MSIVVTNRGDDIVQSQLQVGEHTLLRSRQGDAKLRHVCYMSFKFLLFVFFQMFVKNKKIKSLEKMDGGTLRVLFPLFSP